MPFISMCVAINRNIGICMKKNHRHTILLYYAKFIFASNVYDNASQYNNHTDCISTQASFSLHHAKIVYLRPICSMFLSPYTSIPNAYHTTGTAINLALSYSIACARSIYYRHASLFCAAIYCADNNGRAIISPQVSATQIIYNSERRDFFLA